jgi:hypothetical protein
VLYLGANSTLTGSNVTFKGTINGANSLTVNASGITDFQQAIGGTNPLNSLTTDAAGKTQINANVTTTGSQTYNDTVEIQNPITLTTTNNNIAFNKTVDSQSGETNNLTLNSGTGNVSFNNSVGNTTSLGNLSVNSGGTTLFNNTVKATSLTTDAEGSSQINGNITTTGSQNYNDAVNLQGNTTLTGNNVAFQNTVDGSQTLTVNASGTTHFEKAVGGTTALTALTTDATGSSQINGNVTTTGNQTYNDTVEIQNPVTLSTTNSNIAFDKTVDSQSGEANDLTLNSGTGNVSFNNSVGNTTSLGNLSVNSSGTTLFNNTVKAASLTTDATGSSQINGNVTTTGNQNYNDTVEIQNPITLTTTNSNIAFNETVDSQSGETNDLTINSGTGNVSFNNSVGNTTSLGNLSVNSGGTTLFNNTVKATSLTTDAEGSSQINGNITTTGNQNYNDTVEIQNPVTLTTTNSNIAFDKTVDSQSGETNDLTINSGTGNVSFNNSVGNTTSLGNLSVNSGGTTLFNNTVKATSLTTDAEGSSQINGNITTTGSQNYNDAVNLQGNTTLTGDNVAFQNTIDGNQALTVNSSGVTHFEKAVGNTTALNSLTTDATGTTEIKDNIATTGNQTYNDAVTLQGNSTLTGNQITLSNVTGNNNFSVNAGQDIILNANSAISTGTGNVQFDAVRAINLSSGSSITTTSGTINLNANKNGTGTGRFVGINLGNSSINSQTGNITLFGQGGNTIGFGGNDGIGTGANTIETGGNIDLTAIGGAGSGSSGIDLYGGSIKTTGTGNINITGTGGTGTENNEGILIYNGGKIQSASGNIHLTGFGKTGTGTEGITARSETGTIGSATTTGNISLTTDTINLSNLTVQGKGNLVLQPLNASTSIGIGDGATGTFHLDSSELSTIQDGFNSITIGRSDNSSEVNVAENVTFNDPVTLRSPSGLINVNNTITGQGDASITLQGTTNLNANLTTNNQNITIDDNTTLGKDSTLSGSNITLSNVTGTTNNFSVNANQDIILNANSAINTGTGNVQFDAARSITLNSGSKIETTSGTINLNANQQTTATTGSFDGIYLNNAGISSDTGDITLKGKAGNTAGEGILLTNGTPSIISGSGDIILIGQAFSDNFVNGGGIVEGVAINPATISSKGTITIDGKNDLTKSNGGGVFISAKIGNDPTATRAINISGEGSQFGVSIVGFNNPNFDPTSPIGNSQSSRDITISGNSINLASTLIQGKGNLFLQPLNASTDIGIGSGAVGNFNLDSSELSTIQNGFSSITIGRSDSSGAINVAGNVTFNDPVTLRSPSGGSITQNEGSINISNDLLNLNVTGDISLNSKNNNFNTVTITNGQNVTLADANSINLNTATTTGNFTVNAGQDIILNTNSVINTGTGNVQFDATHAIKLSSGSSITTTSGAVNLTANEGGIRADSSSITTTTGNITLKGTNNATGSFQDGILLYDNSAIRSQDGNIRLEGTSNANGENNDGVEINDGIGNIVEITGSGNITIVGTATVSGEGVNTGRTKTNTGSINITGTGINDPDGAIKVFQVESTGGGNITLIGNTINLPRTDNILKSTGNLTIDGNTNLGANSTLIGNNITFKGTINGANSLIVNASGITDFQQAIGGTTALNSLTTDAAGTTQINGNITTTGSQTYNDTVEIQNLVTLTTTNSDIGFNKTVDSQSGEANDLTLNSGTGNISFNNSVGDTTSLGNLSFNSSHKTLFNNTVKATSLTTDAEGSSQINGNVTTTGNQTYNDSLTIINNPSLTSITGAIAIKETNITGDLTLTANNLEIEGKVSGNGGNGGNGSLTLQPYSNSLPINLGDNLSSDELAFTLSSTELNQLQPGFSQILIGQEAGSGQINIGTNVTFTSPVILRSSGASSTINNNIDSNNSPIVFLGSITFGDNATLNAGQSKISFSKAISISDKNITLIADKIDWTESIQGTGTLSLQPSSPGVTTLVGGTEIADSGLDLTTAELNLISPTLGSVTIGNNNNPITIAGPIAFNFDLNLAAANNTITVNQAINTKGKLTLNGETNLNADLTTQGQDLSINGNITLGNIATISTGNSGNINVTGNIQGSHSLNLQAGENLNAQNIDLSNTSGMGATLALTATSGSINTGNLNTTGSTSGGDITIKAKTAITTGAITTSGEKAGNVFIDPDNDVQVGYINAQSSNGVGGNIDIATARFFRATETFVDQNGVTASLSSTGSQGGGTITIRNGGGTTPFIVGDASENGTQGAITSGEHTISPTQSYLFNSTQGNIFLNNGIEVPITDSQVIVFVNPPNQQNSPSRPPTSSPEVSSKSEEVSSEEVPSESSPSSNSSATYSSQKSTVAVVDDIDKGFTTDYSNQLGLPSKPEIPLDNIPSILKSVQQVTGVKSVLIYVFFRSAKSESLTANSSLWELNRARNATENTERRNDDELEVVGSIPLMQ